MKAAIRRKYCLPHQITIESVEQPRPTDNDALVRVFASTVNRTGCANLTAKPFIMRFFLGLFKPRKIILGIDFAGDVIAVGKNVQSVKVGDRVFGLSDAGTESHAEFLVSSEKNVFQIPKNIDYKQAVASLEGAHYAYAFIHKVTLQRGQSVLINGATGGIGSALIQLVKQFDVTITATCDTKNIDLIKSLGAGRIYDYTKEDFTTDQNKYDFIFDAVGKSTFGKCKPLLKENGTYISSELGPYSQNVLFALFSFLFKRKVVFPIPYSQQKTIPYISKLLEQGVYKPVIDREYDLADTSAAYAYVIQGIKTGNVIINS